MADHTSGKKNERKPYKKPVVRTYGNVQQITQGVMSTGNTMDGSTNSGQKTHT